MSFQRSFIKRDTDIPVFMRWIKKNDSVIDLGCGRGLLLERLAAEKQVKGFGIERNPEKILQCLERRVNVIQGDIFDALCKLPDNSADWVVCSRILQELEHPAEVIL
ncbi:MAG: methionine biosynthesis protein MetW, partial [Puniceicoccales bacterium]|nr:methionine biosynthesis protein MetW [Puniceicoccales bacterium]